MTETVSVDLRAAIARSNRRFGIGTACAAARVERLKEKLEVLEEAVALDEAVAEELRQRVEYLDAAVKEPPTGGKESAYEAADRLDQRLGAEAEAAADAAERALDSLAAADAGAGSPEAQTEVASALDVAKLSGLVGPTLPESLAEALVAAGGPIDPSTQIDPEKLAVVSAELSKALAESLAKLAEAGLLHPGALRRDGRLAKVHVCDASCELKPGGS